MTKYAYSLDEERYHGQFDSIEEALADAQQDAENDATEEGEHDRAVWIGEITEATEFLRKRNPIWIADDILERADEYLGDNIGWDDILIDAPEEKRKELGELVTEWLCKNASFSAYGITNAKEHNVTVSVAIESLKEVE